MIFKIFIILFIAFTASRAYLRFKDKSLTLQMLLFWVSLWFITLITVFIPWISDSVATIFGVEHGTDIAFFFTLMLLLYLVFRLYIKLEEVDRSVTDLTISLSKKIAKNTSSLNDNRHE